VPKRRVRRSNRRRNIAIEAIILIILTLGIMWYAGIYPFNLLGEAPTQVVVTIVSGASLNPQLGFDPALITIVIGINNTVVWKNQDTDWHTAHSNIPEFDSKIIQPGARFTHTFMRPGSYPYHCDPHPWMTGLVIVKASNSIGMVHPTIPFQSMIQIILRSNDGIQP
jgi:plastocyanin